MGQFDSIGLKPVGEIGLTKPEHRSSTLTRTENKKKQKQKRAYAAGGGSTPPNKPPKGPTGGKNPKRGGDDEERYKTQADNVIKKGTIRYDDRENPRNAFKNKK